MTDLSQVSDEELDRMITQAQSQGSSPPTSPSSPFTEFAGNLAGELRRNPAAFLSPLGTAGMVGMSAVPTRFLEPVGGAVGGMAGNLTGLPFGATVGAGLGAAAGRGEANLRQGKSPFEGTLKAGAGYAGGTLAGAGLGKVLGAMAGTVKGARVLFSNTRMTTLAEQAREGLQQVGAGSGRAFEASMKSLGGTVDVSPYLTRLLQLQKTAVGQAALEQAMSQAEKVGDTTLMNFLTNPELAQQASPYEAQQIASTLKQLPTVIKRLTANPNVAQAGGKTLLRMGEMDIPFQQMAKQIGDDITALHPQAYPQILKQYGNIQQNVQLLTPEFARKGNRLVQNIQSGFGGGEVGQAVKQTLPEPISQQIFQVAGAKKALKGALALGGIGAAVGGVKKIFSR